MKYKKSLLIILVGIMICAVSAGCSEIKITHPLGKGILLEINDVVCSSGTGALRLLEAQEEYASSEDEVLWTREIGNTTLAKYLKDTVKDELYRYTASEVMARDLTVFLNNEEIDKARNGAKSLIGELSSKYDLARYDIKIEDAEDLFMKRTYYNKVYEKLSENINMEISGADTKAIEIDYVFIPLEDGISIAESIRNEIRNGADFASVCLKNGYDAVINKTITKGTMPAAFESKAYALKDNEVSELIETRDGYYLIYCLEDYLVTESLANSNRIISDAKRQRFQEAFEKFASSAKMRFNDGVWNGFNVR